MKYKFEGTHTDTHTEIDTDVERQKNNDMELKNLCTQHPCFLFLFLYLFFQLFSRNKINFNL